MQSDHLIEAARHAVICERMTEVPAELTVAQWALESGWGAHQPGNNCFGIKAFPGCHGVQSLETFEVVKGVRQRLVQDFATFEVLSECFQKHAELICKSSSYRQVWNRYRDSKCLVSLVQGIAPIYATAQNYDQSLLKIIKMENVASALAGARQQQGNGQPLPSPTA